MAFPVFMVDKLILTVKNFQFLKMLAKSPIFARDPRKLQYEAKT